MSEASTSRLAAAEAQLDNRKKLSPIDNQHTQVGCHGCCHGTRDQWPTSVQDTGGANAYPIYGVEYAGQRGRIIVRSWYIGTPINFIGGRCSPPPYKHLISIALYLTPAYEAALLCKQWRRRTKLQHQDGQS